MRIETIPVHRINPAPYNPRRNLQPGDPEYERICHSVGEFGLVEPLVWNERTGTLVGGHQRFKILRAQGAETVAVSVVDLSPEREKALNVALNKVQGAWDESRLAAVLDDLTRESSIDVELTGFTALEIDELLARVSEDAERDEDFNIARAQDGAPVTKVGDVIELGPHRVVCGRSDRIADVRRALGGATATMLLTDPPYNVAYDASVRGSSPRKSSLAKNSIRSDDLDDGAYRELLTRAFRNAQRSLAPGSAVYVWNGHKQFGLMHELFARTGMRPSCVITWDKGRLAPGRGDYQQQTEFCLYGWVEGAAHRYYGDRTESTLWRVDRDAGGDYLHPTQKPLPLPERAIRNSSRAGEIVLDLFLGSGSTLIACQRLGRVCRGVELDPVWCDVIARRWIAFVGAERAGDDLVAKFGVMNEVPEGGNGCPKRMMSQEIAAP